MKEESLKVLADELNELKLYIRPVAILFTICLVGSFYISESIISHIRTLYGVKLIAIHPYEILMTQLNISLYISMILCFPIFILQVTRYFMPGMMEHEKRAVKRAIPFVFIMSFLGMSVGGFLLTDMAVNYFISLQQSTGVINQWAVSNLIGFIFKMSLAAVVVFNIPVIVHLLITTGIVSRQKLVSYRPIIVVSMGLLAAIISPPDIMSMLLLFIPSYLFFELGLITPTVL